MNFKKVNGPHRNAKSGIIYEGGWLLQLMIQSEIIDPLKENES